jgi:tetratricopeptide (TPR) repeat protein
LTAEEQKIIAQMKAYIEVKSGGSVGVSDGPGAQAKFDLDYRAGRYRAAIDDADLLRKYGVLNSTNLEIIAQAYYKMGAYAECARFARSNGGGEGMLRLQMTCASQSGDDAAMRNALEQLVGSTGKAEYWSRLLRLAERAKGLSDHQTLDIYRIKFLTGSITGADEYETLATLAIQFGFDSEAQTVIQKGMAAKLLNGDRDTRLLNRAKQDLQADLTNLGKTVQAANASKSGDLLVKLGEDYCGMGRYPDAVAAIQGGIKKGVSDQDNATIRLGQALYGAGQKDAAIKAFAKATTPNGEMTAHLWSLYVHGH